MNKKHYISDFDRTRRGKVDNVATFSKSKLIITYVKKLEIIKKVHPNLPLLFFLFYFFSLAC